MKKNSIAWWREKVSSKAFNYFNYSKKILDKFSFAGNPSTIVLDFSFKLEQGKPLTNIPYAVKDNISTIGYETYCGSNILKEYNPPFNATIIDLLNSQGAQLVFKTILDELGMGGTGLLSSTRKLYSPWNRNRILGGSSSGSCLATTIGLVPFAIGSDTGDSVRRPAALNGIVGFKPSWGVISRYGLMPYAPSLDTIAWFTNCIIDCQTILEVLNKYDYRDNTMMKEPLKKTKKETLIIGYDKALFSLVKNKIMKEKYFSLIKTLKNQTNIVLKEIQIDKTLLELAWPTYSVISFVESLSSNFNLGALHFGKQHNGDSFVSIVNENRGKGFGKNVKKRFSLAALCLHSNNQKDIYLKAKKVRTLIQKMYDKLFKTIDIIISPSTDDITPLISSSISNKIEKKPNLIVDNAIFANLNGHPSISMPIDYVINKNKSFPFSIFLEADHSKDFLLLKFAKEIENIVFFKNILQENTNV